MSERSDPTAETQSPLQTRTPNTDLPQSEAIAIAAKADDITQRLRQDPANRDLLNAVRNVGAEAQRESAGKIQLLEARVGSLMNNLDGPGANIPQGLADLHTKLEQLNPHALSKRTGLGAFFANFLPWMSKVLPPLRALQQIRVRYKTVGEEVTFIEHTLREGQDVIMRDNAELEVLYEQVENAQITLRRNIHLGEILLKERLPLLLQEETDPARKARIQEAMSAVALRVQDLRTMEQANIQFLISMDMTIANNDSLREAVNRTITVSGSVIKIGLAIQVALVRQKQIAEMTRQTREFAGQVLADNAAAIRQQTQDIGQLLQDPVVAIDQVKKAYDDLVAAVDAASAIRAKGIQNATGVIDQLTQMSKTLEAKAGIASANRKQLAPESLEA